MRRPAIQGLIYAFPAAVQETACSILHGTQVDHKWKLDGAEERAAGVLRARLKQAPHRRKP